MTGGPGFPTMLNIEVAITVPPADSEGVATPSEYPLSIYRFGSFEHARWIAAKAARRMRARGVRRNLMARHTRQAT